MFDAYTYEVLTATNDNISKIFISSYIRLTCTFNDSAAASTLLKEVEDSKWQKSNNKSLEHYAKDGIF